MQQKLIATLDAFDATLFMAKFEAALKEVALGVSVTGKKGSVSITLDLERIGDSASLKVSHTLKRSKPTANGKNTEENTTSTPMYCNGLGELTISPESQADLFKSEA